MQPRATINRLSIWAGHQVTATDLETQTGRVVTPVPTSRTTNRFDFGEESSVDSKEEEVDFDDEYLDCDSFDKEYDIVSQEGKDPPNGPEPSGTATEADNNLPQTATSAASPGDPNPNGPGGGAAFDDDWILDDEFIMPNKGTLLDYVKKYFPERWKTQLHQEKAPKVETIFRVQEACANVLRGFEWADTTTGHSSIIQEETTWLAITEGTAREETAFTAPPVWSPRLDPATHTGAQLAGWKFNNDTYNLYWF